MKFNQHLDLVGKHAFLSASKYSWINYTDEKLDGTFRRAIMAQRGSELHEFAFQCIRLKQRLQASKKTLNMYVNDAIGFRMIPEQVLYFSDNSFGTADAIWFGRDHKTKEMLLRIHDLKTGETRTSVHQLEVYAALFCLEYGVKPHEIVIELRIYQNDFIQVWEADPDDIVRIMGKIIAFDRRIENIRMEELS